MTVVMPGADQREARRGRKLFLGFSSEEGFGFACRTGCAADRRPTGGACSGVSGGACPLEAGEELAFGALHGQRGFGIGLGLGEALQLRQRDSWPQEVLAARQFAKQFERRRPAL